MTLPQKFPTPPPSAIASYDYVDIASGTGHVTFYGSGALTGAGSEIYLIQNQFYGNVTILEGTHVLDLSPFNFPKVLKGTAYIDFWLYKSTTDTNAVTMKFQKVSDTTTDISSATVTRNITTTGYNHLIMPISLTETHFKRGDILRLHIVIPAVGGANSIDLFPLGSYPFILSIPFRTEL